MKKQAGFSLVELVIVIIVVGLLAVAALPRFLNVTDEAKKAQIEGVAGGFATAVLSARAQWEAYGRPQENNKNVVNYDGIKFFLSNGNTSGTISDGYPLYVEDNNRTATNVNSADCLALINNLMQNPPAATTSPTEAKNGNNLFFVRAQTVDSKRFCEYYQLASSDTSGNGDFDVNNSGHYFSYLPAKGQVQVTLK